MQLAFRKMHGAGNDFLVIDQRRGELEVPAPEKIRELADRRTGIGFDQLMWIDPPRDDQSVAYYRVFNADGGESEQCGNGVRCVAWVIARDSGRTGDFTLGSLAGPIPVRILGEDSFAASMGKPVLDPADIPFIADARAPLYALNVGGEALSVSVLSMGNPHCVLEVDRLADAAIDTLGPVLEMHERFPSRTNVGFMAIRSRGQIDLRVHERGVGETRACGTGACAAVVAGRILDKLDEDVEVSLPGGRLMVSWPGELAPVWLSGDARLSFEGMLDI
ncbi:MAG: diaminopimelate epimerase [Woeseia sp.]